MSEPGGRRRHRLRRWHDRRRLWAGLAVAAALAIAWGSLTPAEALPRSLPWDKASHLLGYAALAGLSALAGLRALPAFAVAWGFGAAIEFAQLPVPGRLGGDPADLLANALGAAAGVLALAALRRGFLRESS